MFYANYYYLKINFASAAIRDGYGRTFLLCLKTFNIFSSAKAA